MHGAERAGHRIAVEQRKFRDPKEFHLGFRDEAQSPSDVLADAVQCGARNAVRTGDEQRKIALSETQLRVRSLRQEFGSRSVKRAVDELQTEETSRTSFLRLGFDLIDLLSRKRRAAWHANATHASARIERRARDCGFAGSERIARIKQLELIPRVGPVGTVALHRLGVRHPRKVRGNLHTTLTPQGANESLAQTEDVLGLDER